MKYLLSLLPTNVKFPETTSSDFPLSSSDPLFNILFSTFEIILILYLFVVSALICDTYLVPIVSVIAKRSKLSSHAGGAIFLAFVSSIPEMTTSFLTVFSGSKQEMNLGLGALIGSGVAEFTLVLSVACLTVKEYQKVNMMTLGRDLLFYVLSVAVMLIISFDHKIYCFEAMILLAIWIGYASAIIYFDSQPSDEQEQEGKEPEEAENSCQSSDTSVEIEGQAEVEISKISSKSGSVFGGEPSQLIRVLYEVLIYYPTLKVLSLVIPSPFEELRKDNGDINIAIQSPDGHTKDEEEIESLLDATTMTTNTSSEEECRKTSSSRLLASFVMSFAAISLVTLTVLKLIDHITSVSGLQSAKMGLVFMGLASNIPDMINVYVAVSSGYLELALGMIPGAQILNLLLGLGMPWLAFCILDPSKAVEITAKEDIMGIEVLMGVILTVIMTLTFSGGKIGKLCCIPLILSYFGFVTVFLLPSSQQTESITDKALTDEM